MTINLTKLAQFLAGDSHYFVGRHEQIVLKSKYINQTNRVKILKNQNFDSALHFGDNLSQLLITYY